MEQRPGRRRPAVLITDRDRVVLGFGARHRLIQAPHVAALLGVSEKSAAAIMRRLSEAGYLHGKRIYDKQPTCYRIRQKGIDVIGGRATAPGTDLRAYEHDIGLAWLWLAARDGAFGRLAAIVSERELRSHDEAPGRSGPPLAVRLGGVGRGGRERLHYPDLLVHRQDGRTVAIELELTSKSRTRVEGILGGYAADGRIDAVLYLVRNRTIGNSVLDAARRVGIEDLVHVQLVRYDALRQESTRQEPARVRTRGRTRVRASGAREDAAAAERGL